LERKIVTDVGQGAFSGDEHHQEFNAPYYFEKSDRIVVIQTPNGRYLRVNPEYTDGVDANGATGPFAHWRIELQDLGQFMLKSERTGKYLRVHEDEVDCRGEAGKWCLFRYHQLSETRSNRVKLEAVHSQRKFLHADLDGSVRTGAGLVNAELTFFHEGSGITTDTQFPPIAQMVISQTPVVQSVIQHEEEKKVEKQIEQQIEKQMEVQAEVKRSPEALEVVQWLEKLGVGQYADAFIRNGFDRMDSIYKIEENDLKSMGVALGHIKIILGASGNAQYLGKTIVLRSTHGYFLTAEKPSGKEGKFDHHDKREGAALLVVKDLGANKIGIECKQFGTYMHVPPPDSGLHVRHGPLDPNNTELCFVNINKPGWIAIKCVSNGAFLALEEKKIFGRSIVTTYDLGKDTSIEIMILQ